MDITASLIIIVNKSDIFDGFVENLNSQKDISFELIPVMNTDNEYSSARRAYNEASSKASGKYVVFCHPDIRFLNEHSLRDVISFCEKIEDFGVVGIAGAAGDIFDPGKGRIITSIVHGDDAHHFGDRSPEDAIEVQTVDECLFVVRREYLKNHPFPDRGGWHLYAVEYCLMCIVGGLKNYVVPADIWHMSEGRSLDEKYVEQVDILVNEYRNRFKYIHTTIRTWATTGLAAVMFRRYYWFKQLVKRIIRN